VNEKGEYEQTTDRDGHLRYFIIEKLSGDRDYYGVHKRRLGPLRRKKRTHCCKVTISLINVVFAPVLATVGEKCFSQPIQFPCAKAIEYDEV
jgi:hypothetical protein